MQVHELTPAPGARKSKKIVGRGRGSGHGKTSGRGYNGQKSRSGRGMLGSLEGGQMALIRRLPKVGFRSRRPVLYKLVKLTSLNQFKEGTTIDAETLKNKGLVEDIFKPFKILDDGEIKKALTVEAYAFSKTAAEKLVQAGGKIVSINQSVLKKRKSS